LGRQHSTPYLVTSGASIRLERSEPFPEARLQDFIFEFSQSLPIAEIEPAFGPLIPICKELRTNAGPVDLLFINNDGLLTLVECKLWKNPEARREVIGQILDYAKEISSWTYNELQAAIRKSSKQQIQSLYQLVGSEELDESEFIDSVVRNLKRGRFLLLIVGSGIRESVELITDFLQRHAHMNFSLALVEVAIFQMPSHVGSGHLVLPRVVAQTVEVERAVIRIEDGKLVVEPTPEPSLGPGGKASPPRTKISEQVFYEKLAETDRPTSNELRSVLDGAKRMGWSVDPGKNSQMLKFKSGDVELNFGVFRTDGSFQNATIAGMTDRIGHREIGETYLTRLASLLDGRVDKSKNIFFWTVKKSDGSNLKIAEVLAVRDKWLEIIQDTIDQLLKAQEKES